MDKIDIQKIVHEELSKITEDQKRSLLHDLEESKVTPAKVSKAFTNVAAISKLMILNVEKYKSASDSDKPKFKKIAGDLTKKKKAAEAEANRMIAQLDRDVELSLEGIREVIEEEFDKLSENKNCGCGKTPCETYGNVNEMEGVPHYTKDGKEWTGPTHKMPDGSLMTQDPHNKDSEKLYHKEDLKEAGKLSKKQSRDLKIKINNARTIGKYFTKDEATFLQSLFENKYKAGDTIKLRTGETVKINQVVKGPRPELNTYRAKVKGKQVDFSLTDIKEDKLNEAEKYITNKFKVGEEVYLLGAYWHVAKTNFKPGKSYKDSFTFVDNKRVNIKAPPTNKNAVGYKLEDGSDSAFYYCYKAGSGKTIMKLAIKGFNESVNESSSIWKALDAKWKLYDESMDIENDLKNITLTIKQLHKNMEQEAEPEGGKVADKYGREIEKYEKMYKKRKAEFKKVSAKIDKMEQY